MTLKRIKHPKLKTFTGEVALSVEVRATNRVDALSGIRGLCRHLNSIQGDFGHVKVTVTRSKTSAPVKLKITGAPIDYPKDYDTWRQEVMAAGHVVKPRPGASDTFDAVSMEGAVVDTYVTRAR